MLHLQGSESGERTSGQVDPGRTVGEHEAGGEIGEHRHRREEDLHGHEEVLADHLLADLHRGAVGIELVKPGDRGAASAERPG